MKIYFAGVSRIVQLEMFLVKRGAGRLLSFYYENENKKATKAFRIWRTMKKDPDNIKAVEELFAGSTKRKGLEATHAEMRKKDVGTRAFSGFKAAIAAEEAKNRPPRAVLQPRPLARKMLTK